jgi:arylsulfatase A-like enzyme
MFLASGCGSEAPTAKSRPNILLISLDSTRRDRLGCYGNRPPHANGASPSPHLDALAARGVKLADALSASSWTLPSHMSLFTGQGLRAHAVEMDHLRMCASSPVLAEVLAAHGYRTAGFASGPYLDPLWGFGRGFQRYEICYGTALSAAAAAERVARAAWESADAKLPDAERAALFNTWRDAHKQVETLSHQDVSSEIVTDRALEELRAARGKDEPFLVFAHYFDPHYDYVPPAPFDTQFDPHYAGELDGREFFTNPAISTTVREEPGRRVRNISERDLEHVFALYDGEVAWVDHQIGRLLAELDAQGLAKDTLVIVTADHGDEFFEHGGLGHRRTLYEEVVRVPLIVAWPARLAPRDDVRGTVVSQDVLPTILELLDLPAPAGITGASFGDLLRGEPARTARASATRLVVLDSGEVALDKAKPRETAPAQVVRVTEAYHTGTLKLLRRRTWIESPFKVGGAKREAFEALKRAQFERELLEWIDVAEHPDEPDEAWSTDFSNPAARAALDAWRAEYAAQAGLRCNPAQADKDAGMSAQLGNLGYTDSSGASQVDTSLFELPPPGALLGDRPGR